MQKKAIVLFFLTTFGLHADPIVGGFLTPVSDDLVKEISTKSELRTQPNRAVGGITLSYCGYRDVTNNDGLWRFPQGHTGTTLEFIITPRVAPKKIAATISHLTLDESQPADFYRFEKKTDEKGRWFWKAMTSSKPQNGVVPSSSIIIFAHPDDIYVNLHEDLQSSENNQLMIPYGGIYVLHNEPSDLAELETATRLVDASQLTENPNQAAPTDGGEQLQVEQSQLSGNTE